MEVTYHHLSEQNQRTSKDTKVTTFNKKGTKSAIGRYLKLNWLIAGNEDRIFIKIVQMLSDYTRKHKLITGLKSKIKQKGENEIGN